MAIELLQTKDNYKELSKNWVLKFLSYHFMLQAKYSHTLDQNWFLALDHDIIQDWFNLYQFTKAKHGIPNKNMYNIYENGYIIGIAGSSKVVFSKYQKQAFIN